MKQTRLLLTTIAALLCSLTASAHDFEVDGIYYKISSSEDFTVSVTYQGDDYYSYDNEYSGAITIPSTITYDSKTYSVTSIGSYAFSGCGSLTSITIPEGVTTIGYYAFKGCCCLTSSTIPKSVASIEWGAFSDCSSLTSITIPDGVTSIRGSAFSGCSSLASIIIPESVTSIGYGAFSGCSSLTSITIPESVTSIEESAFSGCSSLTSITIPDGVTSIESKTFSGCSSLTSITIPESVTNIVADAFLGTPWYDSLSDGAIYWGTIFYGYKGAMPENFVFEIKEGTTSISERAFEGQSGLASVIIPNSVADIGIYAFKGCTGLKEVVIPGSVEKIDGLAFDGCSGLTDVVFAEGVVSVDRSFRGCTSIQNISIPSTMTDTDINTSFSDSKDIQSITVAEGNPIYSSPQGSNAVVKSGVLVWGCKTTTIPSSVHKIGAYSFNASCIDNLSIPECVKELEDCAFRGCDTIRKLTIPSSITKWGEYIGPIPRCVIDSLFLNNNNTCMLYISEGFDTEGTSCLSEAEIKHLIIGEGVTRTANLPLPKESLTIPSTLKVFGKDNWHPTSYKNFPKQVHVKDIAAWLNITVPQDSKVVTFLLSNSGSIYYKGELVKNLSIPKEVKTIRRYAFYRCDSLESVVLHDGITEIGDDAFSNCSNLDSIVSLSRTAPKVYRYINDYSFKGISKTAVLYYPQGCDYSSWEKYIPGGMQELPNRGICGDSLMWHFNEATGNLNFYGTKAMTDYMSAEAPWYKYVRSITTATIDERVTSVGDYAFYGCRGLDTIYCYAEVPPATGNNTFYNVDRKTCILMVPESAYDEYWWHSEWGEFLHIKKIGVVEKYKITYVVDGEEYLTDSIACNEPIVLAEEPTKEGYTFSGWSEAPETMPANEVTISGTFTVNKYLVTFMIGDEVIAADSLEYGAAIVVPEAPEKEGHTFNGWGEVVDSVPANDLTYEGSYSVNSYLLSYTVDGETVQADSVAYGTAITLLEEPTKEGYTFSGWNEALETMPANDVVISGTFIINKYLVTFMIGDEVIAADSLEYGAAIVVPEAPEKEGHTFNGWGEVADSVPANDLTYEGSYSVNSYLLSYTVDGETVQADSVAYGTAITLLEEPTKEGYTFSGWSEAPETMPANDVVISGTFTINKYLVTFKIGDEVIAADSLEYGTAIVAPEAPEKEGYTFDGWGEVAETVPAGDVTYEGTYTVNIYKVYYYVGEELVHTAEVAYGEAIPEYVYEPTEEGYTFLGWMGETYETMPAHDVTYTANIDDGIHQLTNDNGQMTIYDLTGRKVQDTENLKGGIYIVNGRKVVIK